MGWLRELVSGQQCAAEDASSSNPAGSLSNALVWGPGSKQSAQTWQDAAVPPGARPGFSLPAVRPTPAQASATAAHAPLPGQCFDSVPFPGPFPPGLPLPGSRHVHAGSQAWVDEYAMPPNPSGTRPHGPRVEPSLSRRPDAWAADFHAQQAQRMRAAEQSRMHAAWQTSQRPEAWAMELERRTRLTSPPAGWAQEWASPRGQLQGAQSTDAAGSWAEEYVTQREGELENWILEFETTRAPSSSRLPRADAPLPEACPTFNAQFNASLGEITSNGLLPPGVQALCARFRCVPPTSNPYAAHPSPAAEATTLSATDAGAACLAAEAAALRAPGDAQAWLSLGHARLRAGDASGAALCLERVLDPELSSSEFQTTQAAALLLSHCASCVPAKRLLAWAARWLALVDPALGTALLRSGAAGNAGADGTCLPPSPPALEVVSALCEAASSGPPAVSAEPLTHLALALVVDRACGRLDTALPHYERAASLAAQGEGELHTRALCLLGSALSRLGHSRRAEEVLGRVVAQRPGDAQLWLGLAEALDADPARTLDAARCFLRAGVLAPGLARAWAALAVAVCALGRADLVAACDAGDVPRLSSELRALQGEGGLPGMSREALA